MKKLLVTLALAGTLSVPSVVFSEATWYGSLRGGLHVGGGGDAQYYDGGSRWGIKGSAEVSDGLTAVYRFEHKISTADASQPAGRLAYAGLSGGFGTITVGHIWNAAYNHAGAITDKSFYFGDAGTGYRHGHAISYAFSSGAVGFQVDLAADGSKQSGKAIDKTEFGVTIGLGEVGKVALAHTSMQDYPVTNSVFDPGSLPSLTPGTPPSLTPGTPPSLNPGTLPTLMPGTLPTLMPGTQPTLMPGTLPSEETTPTNVSSTNLALVLRDGNVVIDDTTTTWTDGAANGFVHNRVEDGSVMHSATVVTNVNTPPVAISTADDDTDDDVSLTRVVVRHTGAGAPTFGALPAGTNAENNYMNPDCNNAGQACRTDVGYVGTYTHTDATDGTETEVTFFVPSGTADVTHTAMVNVLTGINPGAEPTLQPGTLPSLQPGTLPSLEPGTLPSLQPGALPSLEPGTEPTLEPGTEPTLDAGTLPGFVNETTTKYGHKVTHVAVEFGLGGVTPYLGYSERKENNETAKSKTTHYGFSGSLGDTGMSYLVMGRNAKESNGDKSSPWLFNVSKGLGGGATVIFEHSGGNKVNGRKVSAKSRVGLHVSF